MVWIASLDVLDDLLATFFEFDESELGNGHRGECLVAAAGIQSEAISEEECKDQLLPAPQPREDDAALEHDEVECV